MCDLGICRLFFSLPLREYIIDSDAWKLQVTDKQWLMMTERLVGCKVHFYYFSNRNANLLELTHGENKGVSFVALGCASLLGEAWDYGTLFECVNASNKYMLLSETRGIKVRDWKFDC